MTYDPVCWNQVDPAKAIFYSEYNGKTFYFCSQMCQRKFEFEPGRYEHNIEPVPMKTAG